MNSTFRLVQRTRECRALGSGASKSARRFLDFEVDGESLYDELQARGFDHIGAIWLGPRVEGAAEATVARLLGQPPPDLLPDRVAVFVCPECGDLGCGAVTVRLSVESGLVTWSDSAWQTNYDLEPDRSVLEDMAAISFERATYDDVLLAAGRT